MVGRGVGRPHLEVVAAKDLKLFAVIDHSGEARAAGLELRDTKLVIFGSPAAGTPVAGIDAITDAVASENDKQ